jgi:hypothetical protein
MKKEEEEDGGRLIDTLIDAHSFIHHNLVS